jgi:type IV secretion system protein VirB10
VTSRRLRKGPIIAALIVITLAVGLALFLALLPGEILKPEALPEAAASDVPILESIKNAQVTTPSPPVLGEPLSGHLAAQTHTEGPLPSPAPAPTASGAPPPPSTSTGPSLRTQEREKARHAALFFDQASKSPTPEALQSAASMQRYLAAQEKQLQALSQAGLGEGPPSALGTASPSSEATTDVARQNMQGQKAAFLAAGASAPRPPALAQGLLPPQSPYEVKAGAIIPAVLITGIHTDLPGDIIAQVRERVYDTVSGNTLLIPQGARLLASYNSVLTYGQERILICWNRIIFPNGHSLDLECAPGADSSGYAGVSDTVNHHYGRLIVGVLFSSVLAASAPMATGNVSGAVPTWPQQFGAAAGQHVNSAGQAWAQKQMNLQPTLTVRPGWSLNIIVNKDWVLTPYHD